MLTTSPRHRSSSHDTQREIALARRAELLTDLDTSIKAAVSELRAMSDGRPDLLAAAAASQLGTYIADPHATDPNHVLAGALLLLAGADTDLVTHSMETDRRRAVAPPSVQPDSAPSLATQLRSMPSGPDICSWLLER